MLKLTRGTKEIKYKYMGFCMLNERGKTRNCILHRVFTDYAPF